MSGVTDSPFRRLVRHCSGDDVGLLVSEFIPIEGLTRGVLRSTIRMVFHPSERHLCVQIYGADADKMAEAAKIVEDAGIDLVDINCGCPAPKIVKRGGGAGLLKDLPALGRILETTVKAVSIPVTVKIRNGWSDDAINALETLKVAEENGAQAIAVHGRSRMQLYRGEADWDIVRQMKEEASIPVLGSGDVCDWRDAQRRFQETGCDGVLIGRGAITNPWIFRQIAQGLRGEEVMEPTWRQKIEAVGYYRDLLLDHYPPRVTPGRMKMMLSRLIKGMPEAADVRLRCLRCPDPHDMLEILRVHCEERGIMDEAATDTDKAAA